MPITQAQKLRASGYLQLPSAFAEFQLHIAVSPSVMSRMLAAHALCSFTMHLPSESMYIPQLGHVGTSS